MQQSAALSQKPKRKILHQERSPYNTSKKLDNTNLLLLLNELPAQLNAQQELITCSGIKTPPKHLLQQEELPNQKKRDNTQQQQQQLPVIKLPPKT
jgi:hypothetical protein